VIPLLKIDRQDDALEEASAVSHEKKPIRSMPVSMDTGSKSMTAQQESWFATP
jgi:hypothetical protein